MLLVLVLTLLPALVLGEQLKNADLDSTTYSASAGWWCNNCAASGSTDRHSGSHSVKVTNRKHDWAGITQTFSAKGGHLYFFQAYVKILNLAQGKMYHTVYVMLEIKDNGGHTQYIQVGYTPHIKPGDWHIVGGDFRMPNSFKEARVYIQIQEPEVNYLLDSATIQEIPHISNLKSETDGRIHQLRTANINIRITDNHVHPSGLSVEVHQTSSEFGWGSAVDANDITDSQHKKYQDYFYDNFEWAVLENALKWYAMEPNEGQNNVALPNKAVNTLRSKGIKVRGHNIFWAVPRWAPKWQSQISASDLKKEMQYRIGESVGYFKGRLPHWDVNNENTHGDFYAQRLHDPDITSWMFREAHKADPSTLLFLNDFDIVSGHHATVGYEDQAQYLRSEGVPVQRIGIQSHLGGGSLDIDAIKHRLDEMARVGLKMWITELDIDDGNENTKADKYEQVMRLYFSHPAVEGVMFWGYWDGRHWRPNAALANGPNVTPNAAGRRVRQLIKGEWRTNESHSVKEGQNLQVRGYKGSYTVQVKNNGNVIKTEHFTLSSNGVDLTISLSGSGNNPHVNNIIIG